MYTRSIVIAIAVLMMSASGAKADVRSKIVREVVEATAVKLGLKLGKEAVEAAAKTLDSHVAKHGDDALRAFRQVGTKSFDVAEKHGRQGLAMVARHGDDAIVHVLSRPKALSLATKFGDDAAEVLVKHPGIAENVLEKAGAPAVKAMSALDGQNGRRLAMMAADGGSLSKIGRTDELMGVIAKHGNAAMAFIWKNKIELSVAAALTAFIADPEPFINGTRDLSKIVTDSTLSPVAAGIAKGTESALASAVPEVSRATNWTAVFLTAVLAPVLLTGLWVWRRSSRAWPAVPGVAYVSSRPNWS
jgi:hypothetical protein